MKKNIKTLVDDIYNLFGDEPNIDKKELDKHVQTFCTEVGQQIITALFEDRKRDNKLRLSAIGKPDRQLWYNVNQKNKAAPLPPSTRIKFLYGHILEELLLLFTKVSGHSVRDTQKELLVSGVKGHQDAIIDDVLVDCKSASGRGFEKFKNNRVYDDDPFGYIPQISAYAQANGLDEAAFLAIDKSTGEICLTPVHSLEMINAEERVDYLKEMVSSDSLPDKCYSDIPDGKSGNRRLAVGCVYCDYKQLCWSDSNGGKGLRVFNYAQNKKYLTEVAREPDVLEIKES
tara:strand:+ start:16258 stop:17118 length:861 start_codon:yes stop_codon:yes gene_type:complete